MQRHDSAILPGKVIQGVHVGERALQRFEFIQIGFPQQAALGCFLQWYYLERALLQ